MARFSALSAAIVALAFSSQAALVAGQAMDPCVAKSITAAGCSPQDVKCMCKGAAEGNLLTDVLTGMVQYCPKTVDVSGLFATLSTGCKAAGVAIPPQNIQDAQQLAGSVFGPGAGGSNGGGNGGGSGTNTSSAQGSVVTKPPTSGETQGLGAPVSQPTSIGQSTVVINTSVGAGSGGSNTMITAPSTTPKPNPGSPNSGASQSISSGAPAQSGGAATGTGNNQNAGVRSTASLGAAVIGLAAAVMMW